MFANIYHGKKVLVTGHTGFKGAWLTAWLLDLGAMVTGFSKHTPKAPALFALLDVVKNIRHCEGDLADFQAVKTVVDETSPDFIFHLAAQALIGHAWLDPLGTLAANVTGTAHVLEAVRLAGRACTVVMVTSDKCYDPTGRPDGYQEDDPLAGDDVYSASKAAAEGVARAWHRSFFPKKDSPVRVASCRAGNVVGGGDWAAGRIVPDCIRAWSAGQPVQLRNPQAVRPWQHVLEPLSGYLCMGQLLAANPDLSGEAFNFGPSPFENHSVLALLEALGRHFDFSKKLPEKMVVDAHPAFQEAHFLSLNCEKAEQRLGWKPTLTFEEMAALTGEWYDHFYQPPLQNMAALTLAQLRFFENKAAERGLAWVK